MKQLRPGNAPPQYDSAVISGPVVRSVDRSVGLPPGQPVARPDSSLSIDRSPAPSSRGYITAVIINIISRRLGNTPGGDNIAVDSAPRPLVMRFFGFLSRWIITRFHYRGAVDIRESEAANHACGRTFSTGALSYRSNRFSLVELDNGVSQRGFSWRNLEFLITSKGIWKNAKMLIM